MFQRWWRTLRHEYAKIRRHMKSVGKRGPRACSPCIEPLEDRFLLSTVTGQYPIPSSATTPYGITAGPDGNLWFTEFKGNRIGAIDPATHAVSEYPIPTSGSAPFGITTGPDGNIWFTETATNQIGMINPATQVISEYPITTSGSTPLGITAGPDGNVWFAESAANEIGMINPSTDAITEYSIPTASSDSVDIIAGPDGNLWFTENGASQIGVINPSTGAIREFATPTSGAGPLGIVAGPDGRLWFTENNVNQLAAINPATGAITEWTLPGSGTTEPFWIAVGPDSNLWYTETSTSQLGELNLNTGTFTQSSLGTGSAPAGIAMGPDGTLWLAESTANQIAGVFLPPTITAGPGNHVIHAGQTTTFRVDVAGNTGPNVQWLVSTDGGENFTPLTNDTIYEGVTTGAMTIVNATQSMSGYEYEAVLSNDLDPSAAAATPAVTLWVKPAMTLPAFAQGTAGASYHGHITVAHGIAPYTGFSVSNFSDGGTGLSAAGITTNSSTGTITVNGTPAAAGDAGFTVSFTDATGATLTQNVTIVVNPPPSLGQLTVSQWTVGKPGFNGTMTISGGTGPFTIVTYSGVGSAWMPVVHGNVISFTGTPVVVGTYKPGSITIQDAAGARVTQTFRLTVNARPALGPLTLGQWTVGQPGFTGTMTLTGGTGALKIVHATGLPTGLTPVINESAITFTGTPTTVGVFANAAISVQDSIGATVTATFSVTIHARATLGNLTRSQWTAGMAGFIGTIPISGGTGPFVIVAANGVPPGLTLVVSGRTVHLAGTPTTAEALGRMDITLADAAGVQVSSSFAITINPPPSLSGPTVTQWTAGKAGFSSTIMIVGGTAPFVIIAASGVPTGLTVTRDGAVIRFTGTPLWSGSFSGSITIRDAAGAMAHTSFSFLMNRRLTATGLTVSQWTATEPGFPGTITVGGGTGGLTITHVTGLPAGLTASLNGNVIDFNGVPATAGTYSGTITLQDSLGATVTKTFTITIAKHP